MKALSKKLLINHRRKCFAYLRPLKSDTPPKRAHITSNWWLTVTGNVRGFPVTNSTY